MLHSKGMTPDSSRQWYLYYQEKESGPITEADLIGKIDSGEVGMDAYVFTEGMTDWALVSDTAVLKSSGKVSAKAAPVSAAADDGGSDLLSGLKFDEASSAKTDRTVRVDSSKLQQMSPDELFGTPPKASGAEPKLEMAELEGAALAPQSESVDQEVTAADSVKTEKKSFLSFLKSKKSNKSEVSRVATPKGSKPAGSRRVSPLTAALLVLVVLAGGAYSYTQMGGQIPFVSDALNLVLGPTATERQGEVPLAAPDAPPVVDESSGTGTGEVAASPPAQVSSVPTSDSGFWSELLEFRKVEDSTGPPFRMASRFLGGDRPVLVGVLSPLIPADEVKVAVFPMNERSLMAVPRVWYFRASVVDGFFTVGPIHSGIDPLKPGKYFVYVQFDDKFLGETEFEFGTWPEAGSLGAIQDGLQKERVALSDQERAALEAKAKELSAALEQLRAAGAKVAGPKAVAQFLKMTQAWKTKIAQAESDQSQLMRGPMFYPKAQAAVVDLIAELRSLHAAIELQGRKGAAALRANRQKGLGQLWAEATRRQQALLGELQAMAMQKEPLALMIDTETVKASLRRM